MQVVDSWLRARLGSRGVAAVLLICAHIGMGVTVYLDPHATPFNIIPFYLRMVGWFGFSAVALATVFTERFEWVAWTLLAIMPTQRAVAYIITAVFWASPGGHPGDPQAAGRAIFWGAFTALTLWVARWGEDEPDRIDRAYQFAVKWARCGRK